MIALRDARRHSVPVSRVVERRSLYLPAISAYSNGRELHVSKYQDVITMDSDGNKRSRKNTEGSSSETSGIKATKSAVTASTTSRPVQSADNSKSTSDKTENVRPGTGQVASANETPVVNNDNVVNREKSPDFTERRRLEHERLNRRREGEELVDDRREKERRKERKKTEGQDPGTAQRKVDNGNREGGDQATTRNKGGLENSEGDTENDVDMVATRSTPRNKPAGTSGGGGSGGTPAGGSAGAVPAGTRQGDGNEIPADYARRDERMTEGAIGTKTYPAPCAFDDKEPLSNVSLFARAPWFDTVALDQEGFCDQYATNGLLPGDVPLTALTSFAWRSYFSCADADLIVGRRQSLRGQRETFTKTVLTSLSKYFTSPIEVPARFEMDLFWYRTRGEMELARNLMDVTDEQLERWLLPEGNGDLKLMDEAYVSNRPQLRAEFRYVKRTSSYWGEQVRQERRCRSMLGYAVPYQAFTAYQMRDGKRARAVVRLPRVYTRIEVPQGCYVDLAAEVSYIGSYLMDDPRSGWWNVFFVAQLMKITAGIMQDVYDTHRLWALAPRCRRWLRQLDGSLNVALGTRANAEDFRRLLRGIEKTNYNTKPCGWNKRYASRPPFCRGRRGAGVDFIY